MCADMHAIPDSMLQRSYANHMRHPYARLQAAAILPCVPQRFAVPAQHNSDGTWFRPARALHSR
eukprot:6584390-Prymnesium_polylepis.1